MKVSITLGWCMTLLALTIPAAAHHSQAAFYDSSKKVEVTGTVADFIFKNPHIVIVVDAAEQGQKVQWQVEMGSTTIMTRQGWTPASIRKGDSIKVVGQPSRAEGTHGICCAQISRGDGSPFVAVRGGRGAAPGTVPGN